MSALNGERREENMKLRLRGSIVSESVRVKLVGGVKDSEESV